jgi:hypothetical protein
MKKHFASAVSAALLTLAVATHSVTLRAAQTTTGSQTAVLGDFKLFFLGGNADLTFGTSRIDAVLTGPNLRITSSRYDMSARRITMTARKANKKSPMKVTDADGTGGARVVVRQPEVQRVTTVTADRFSYNVAATPGGRGRIDLTGNVRSIVRDPSFVQPFVTEAQRGVVTLLPNGEIGLQLSNGSASGQVREPAPKEPKKKDGR